MPGVLITGGTGFIGRYFVKEFMDNGYNVFVSTRDANRARRIFKGSDVNIFQWNPLKQHLPVEILNQSSAVINLIGEPIAEMWTQEKKRLIRESRIYSLRTIVASMGGTNQDGKALVSASAVGYYGNRGDEILTEESTPGNDFLAGICREWEGEAFKARNVGVRVVIMRIGIVLGRSGGILKKMLLPFKLGLGGPIGDGKHWMSWIHVEDLARIARFAVENENISGPINAVSPNPVRNHKFAVALGKILKRPVILRIPKFALKTLYGSELVDTMLTASQRAVPKRLQELGFKFKYPEIESALQNSV
jgi:hypothetical protein